MNNGNGVFNEEKKTKRFSGRRVVKRACSYSYRIKLTNRIVVSTNLLRSDDHRLKHKTKKHGMHKIYHFCFGEPVKSLQNQ